MMQVWQMLMRRIYYVVLATAQRGCSEQEIQAGHGVQCNAIITSMSQRFLCQDNGGGHEDM